MISATLIFKIILTQYAIIIHRLYTSNNDIHVVVNNTRLESNYFKVPVIAIFVKV